MMKRALKLLIVYYFSFSTSTEWGVKINLFFFKCLYNLRYFYRYADRLVYFFQKVYASQHKNPLLKTVKLKNKLLIQVNVIDRLGGLLYFYRRYSEPQTQLFMTEHLRPGDIFIDIGANCGFYTLLAASLVKPTGRVFCFEPNPQFISTIKKSIELNHFSSIVTFENTAISNKNELNVPFYIPSDNISSALGSLITEKPGNLKDEFKSFLINTITLDTYFSNTNFSGKTLIKIDAEGAESLILEGMKNMLEHKIPSYIIMECESMNSPSCHFLAKYGYKITKVELFNSYDNFGNYFFELDS